MVELIVECIINIKFNLFKLVWLIVVIKQVLVDIICIVYVVGI